MQMKKRVLDRYDDDATVTAHEADRSVFLTVSERDRSSQLALSPKQARKLAKALKRGARIVRTVEEA